jgi:hypothetical protein
LMFLSVSQRQDTPVCIARKCSRNRCLARWMAWIPSWAAEAEQVERTLRKT